MLEPSGDPGKILRLVYDFESFKDVGELDTVIYIATKLHKVFNYDVRRFEVLPDGVNTRGEVGWDLFYLQKGGYLQIHSPVELSSQGKELARTQTSDVDFLELKEKLLGIDRSLWPKVAAFLYLCEYYAGAPEKVETALREGYKTSEKEVETIRDLVSQLQST